MPAQQVQPQSEKIETPHQNQHRDNQNHQEKLRHDNQLGPWGFPVGLR